MPNELRVSLNLIQCVCVVNWQFSPVHFRSNLILLFSFIRKSVVVASVGIWHLILFILRLVPQPSLCSYNVCIDK